MIKVAVVRVEGRGPFKFPVMEEYHDLKKLTGRFELRRTLDGDPICEPSTKSSIADRLRSFGGDLTSGTQATLRQLSGETVLVTVDRLRLLQLE